MGDLLGYFVRVIEKENKKIVRLIPITDDKLEFELDFEGDHEIVGILPTGNLE